DAGALLAPVGGRDAVDSSKAGADALADPFPLTALAALLGDVPGADAVNAALRKLQPTDEDPLTVGRLRNQTDLRTARAAAGVQMLGLLHRAVERTSRLAAQSNAAADPSPSGANAADPAFSQALRHFLLAGFAAEGDDPGDAVLVDCRRRWRTERLRWQQTRFAADDASLPEPASAKLRGRVEAELRARGETPPPAPKPRWTLVGSDLLAVPFGETATIDLKLSAVDQPPDSVPADQTAALVLDWQRQREQFLVTTGGEPVSPDARLRFPLPRSTPGAAFVAKVQLRRVAGGNQAIATVLPARVEWSDGASDWLPLSVRLEPAELPPAELVLTWRGRPLPRRPGLGGRLELFPNDAAPLALAVRKNAPGALAVQLLIETGEASGRTLAAEVPLALAETATVVPVAWEAGADLAVRDRVLRLKLKVGDQIVDEAPLELVVASPVEYLQPVIEYDADERRVAATVKPIDGAGRIPTTKLRLELPAAAVKQGNLEAEISTERPTARLTADLKPDAVDENVEVWLHAAEVPRAVRFQTGASLPRGTPLLEPYLDVTAPADGTKFLIAELGPRLPIGLQADGANGAAAGLNALNAAVGFDRDRDGEGEDDEQLAAGVFGDGRSVVVTAVAP
ncbi:MAG: hypothetical protein ACRDD1_01940, partial [Planctomycetia bacterium]